MNITPSTFRLLAISLGTSASLITSASAIAAARKPNSDQGCIAERPRLEPLTLKEPKIAICREVPNLHKRPIKVIKKMPILKSSKQLFVDADKNKDGKLSQEEFSKAFQTIVAQEKSRLMLNHEKVKMVDPPERVKIIPLIIEKKQSYR